jgi:small subunit ribosomal protein S5e
MAEVVEQPQGQQDVKLFNLWSFDDVEVRHWILSSVSSRSGVASSAIDDGVESPGDLQVKDVSLGDYLAVSASKHATYLPHTAGQYSKKRFRKAQCPIVERLTNSLMMHGRNNGKKIMAVASSSTPWRLSTCSPTPTPSRSSLMQSSTGLLTCPCLSLAAYAKSNCI